MSTNKNSIRSAVRVEKKIKNTDMKTKIFGASDDLIEIEGEIEDEANKDNSNFSCSDQTQGKIFYGINGEWKIELSNKGNLFLEVVSSVGDDAKHIHEDAKGCSSYSDVLVLNEGIEWVKIGRKTFKKD